MIIKINAEEVRAKTGMTQEQFASAIGTNLRNYRARLYGERPTWTLNEIIQMTVMNDGVLDVGDYVLTVKAK